jgi:fructokinase
MHQGQSLIGIDLGGTKIEGALIDANHPEVAVARLRIPTESEKGYDHILDRIHSVVRELKSSFQGDPENFPRVVGIGTPGTLDPKTRTLRGSNTQCLNGKSLGPDLEAKLGLQVKIENDANCFIMAEATLGVARGYETVFGIILGTGCGGAYLVHGHVLHGCHGISAEWGQIVVEPGGEMSPHETQGTVEAYIAGPALENFYFGKTGIRRSLKEIAPRIREDEFAQLTIERLQSYFARGLAPIINTFDPHAIVIGGGVGNLDVLYSEDMRRRLSEVVFAPSFEAALLRPVMGDSAGVFGAALLTVSESHQIAATVPFRQPAKS